MQIAIVITIIIIIIIETIPINRTLADLRASITSIRRRTADYRNILKKSIVDLEINIRNDLRIIIDIIVILITGFSNILLLKKVLIRKVFKLLSSYP